MADGSAAPIAADGCATEDGLDVVYFAGCGGSSEAYKIALGKHPDVALNHNEIAIGVHMANCPDTEHFVADVFDVDPTVIRPGVKWRSFWASPDCRHFSKAKGSAPVSPRIRGLAWVVIISLCPLFWNLLIPSHGFRYDLSIQSIFTFIFFLEFPPEF